VKTNSRSVYSWRAQICRTHQTLPTKVAFVRSPLPQRTAHPICIDKSEALAGFPRSGRIRTIASTVLGDSANVCSPRSWRGAKRGLEREPPGDRVLERTIDESVSATHQLNQDLTRQSFAIFTAIDRHELEREPLIRTRRMRHHLVRRRQSDAFGLRGSEMAASTLRE
jgi:hypothetical protein